MCRSHGRTLSSAHQVVTQLLAEGYEMPVFPDESYVFLDDVQAFQTSIAVRVQNSVEGRLASGYGYPVVSGHDYSDSCECGTDAGPDGLRPHGSCL